MTQVTHPTTIILPPETLERLQAMADREGISRHALMCQVLEEVAAMRESGTAGERLSRGLIALLRRQGWKEPK